MVQTASLTHPVSELRPLGWQGLSLWGARAAQPSLPEGTGETTSEEDLSVLTTQCPRPAQDGAQSGADT